MASSVDGLSMYENDIMDDEVGSFAEEPRPPVHGRFSFRECLELNCNWGIAGVTGKAGACWDCFRVEPCCGEPCSAPSCLYCFCCVVCCPLCMHAKILAYSNDQNFYCVNHCGPFLLVIAATIMFIAIISALAYVAPPLLSLLPLGSCGIMVLFILMRRNIRLKYNIGTPNSWIGDAFMSCCPCTHLCVYCQELRAIPVTGWDWLGDIRERGLNCFDGSTLGKIIR